MATLPIRFPVEPMLAAPVTELPTGSAMRGGCWYEPKFDGFRGIVFVEADGARVQSRAGNNITHAFTDIAEAAHEALPPGTVVDGELLIWGGAGLDFSALQRRLASGRAAAVLTAARPASLIVFDVLAVAGTDVRHLHLADRRQLLEQLLDDVGPPLQLIPYSTDADQAREWMETYREARIGIEGLVIKGAGSRYESGRRGWAKLRIRDTVEVIVGAVTGSVRAPGRLVVGFRDDTGRLVIAGSTGPLNRKQREEMAVHLVAADDDNHPWPEVIGPGRMGNWGGDPQPVTRVEPMLVVEVSGDTSLDHGHWRHQTKFVRARPDLDADDVTPLR